MTILCTFPGRFGDLLWALPTVRAIAEATDAPVDLRVAPPYGAICPLIAAQPYIESAAIYPDWAVQETAPMTPWNPFGDGPGPTGYDRIVHLGYRGWPETELPTYIYQRARREYPDLPMAPLRLEDPWITSPIRASLGDVPRVSLGWSEEYFELKVGLSLLLAMHFRTEPIEWWWLRPWGGRYDEVDQQFHQPGGPQAFGPFGPKGGIIRGDWIATAGLLNGSDLYVGCLSASWVLANAVGLPCLVVEPNPQRHHPIFWRTSGRNTWVLGGDGRPTFDARHVADAVAAWMEAR